MQVGIVVYEGFDELDAIGPYEVLRNAARGGADVEALIVAREPSASVTGSHGLAIEPHTSLADGRFGLVIVPGGGWAARARTGAYAEVQQGELPAASREFHARGTAIASVCTGAMILSAAGLLRGRPATAHDRVVEELRAQGAEVVEARVVDDGDILTCGGVTAGIDLALWVVERNWGKPLADGIAREMEHERRGPVWTQDPLATAKQTAAWAADPSEPHPHGIATVVPSELAAAFAILRRPREPSDALPDRIAASFQHSPSGQHYGINPDLSRLAGTPAGTPVWLVPGRTGSAMTRADGSGGAGPNDRVQTEGLVSMMLPTTAGNPVTFVGFVPDGVSVTVTRTDGSAAQVERSGTAIWVSGCLGSLTVHTKTAGDKTLFTVNPAAFRPAAGR
jgi:putative intracellular protease/amidase